MFDEITYALLNSKIKKLEGNTESAGKTKLSEFENDLFYSKEKILCSATKDDFQLFNSEEGMWIAEVPLDKSYSDDLKLEDFKVEIKVHQEAGLVNNELPVQLIEETDEERHFMIFLPMANSIVGQILPRIKLNEEDYTPIQTEGIATITVYSDLFDIITDLSFTYQDTKKISNEVIDFNEFVAIYEITTYEEILNAFFLGKKCYIYDLLTNRKVPVIEARDEIIVGGQIGFTNQPIFYLLGINSNNEWHNLEIKLEITDNRIDDMGSINEPTNYPTAEAVKNALQKVLPVVTKADAGKVLRVSADGVWAAEAIPSAEGVSF